MKPAPMKAMVEDAARIVKRVHGFYAAFDRDVTVRCWSCDRKQVVHYAACLKAGWPTCHGETMELLQEK